MHYLITFELIFYSGEVANVQNCDIIVSEFEFGRLLISFNGISILVGYLMTNSYIYIYMCVCVCVCKRERERENDG